MSNIGGKYELVLMEGNSISKTLGTGTYEQCLALMPRFARKYGINHDGYGVDLVNVESGRLASFRVEY